MFAIKACASAKLMPFDYIKYFEQIFTSQVQLITIFFLLFSAINEVY